MILTIVKKYLLLKRCILTPDCGTTMYCVIPTQQLGRVVSEHSARFHHRVGGKPFAGTVDLLFVSKIYA